MAEAEGPDWVSLSEVVHRLAHSAVASQIRHRALIAILETHEPFDFKKYVAIYQELLDRDEEALFAQLVLTQGDFKAIFSAWKAEDDARYRIPNWKPKARRPQKRVTPSEDS